jgi:predicted phage terminase large subunit-like protein
MGSYTYACQMLMNPKADETQGFNDNWLRFWEPTTANLNIYILCDPASEKKTSSDYTVMLVIGLGADGNYYLIDALRDRLNLKERADALFGFHREYRPNDVGYEKYGMQADIEHMEDRMNRENYRFAITELKGNIPKNDRIRKLSPLFEAGRIYIPRVLWKRTYDGRSVDLIQSFIQDEYRAFPVSVHDDMLDCMARICDPDMAMVKPSGRTNKKFFRQPVSGWAA